MSNFRMIQMTNNAVSASANELIPLGKVTRKISPCENNRSTFVVTTTGADTVNIERDGYYHIFYNFTGTATGAVGIALVINDETVLTRQITAGTAGLVSIAFDYYLRVFPNCNTASTNIPASVQILNSGVAVSAGSGNLVIERVY